MLCQPAVALDMKKCRKPVMPFFQCGSKVRMNITAFLSPPSASLRLLVLAVSAACLVSCETVPAVDESSMWRVTDNGAHVWFHRGATVDRFVWSGPLDAEKKAHGFGKLVQHYPETYGDPIFGGGQYENTATYEGKMVHGRLDGEVIWTQSFNGKIQRDQWANGTWLSGEVIRAGSSGGGSSGLSDSQLVGGLLGLGGIASGDTGLAGAGLTMLSGDGAGGVAQMAGWAGGGSSAGSGNGSVSGTSATPRGTKGNLVTEWGLRKTVKSSQDHMKYYIQAADQAHATYMKSGSDADYQQHRHYAELARDFHERTGTDTQGYAR